MDYKKEVAATDVFIRHALLGHITVIEKLINFEFNNYEEYNNYCKYHSPSSWCNKKNYNEYDRIREHKLQTEAIINKLFDSLPRYSKTEVIELCHKAWQKAPGDTWDVFLEVNFKNK